MLRDEDRMPPHRRLLAVIGRGGGRQALRDECAGMVQHRRHAAIRKISLLLRAQPKSHAKGGSFKGNEQGIEIAHAILI